MASDAGKTRLPFLGIFFCHPVESDREGRTMSTMLLLFIVLYFLKECGLKDFFFPNIRVVVTASRVLLHSRRSSALLTLLVEKLPFARLDGRVVLLRIAANHGPLHFGLMVP